MRRFDAVQALAELTSPDDLFVTSMGGLWDDWLNLRPGGPDHHNTFSPPILGSHASTAFGVAIALPHRRVICMDTDGSILMNIGILCTLGNERPKNLTIIVFDNQIYESIGGPPTHTARNTDLAKIAEGAGCLNCTTVSETSDLRDKAKAYLNDDEMGFIVAKIEPGVHEWPADKRRRSDGVEDKYQFIRYIERSEGISVHAGAPQA
jgi:thiamine pyrophosphate-dependent acetolactate synthase large subunit-like protein